MTEGPVNPLAVESLQKEETTDDEVEESTEDETKSDEESGKEKKKKAASKKKRRKGRKKKEEEGEGSTEEDEGAPPPRGDAEEVADEEEGGVEEEQEEGEIEIADRAKTFRLQATYVYTKLRKEFARPFKLEGSAPRLFVNILPNPKLARRHIRKDPALSTQTFSPWSHREVLTDKIPYGRRNQGHTEGGFPAEVNRADMDMVVRYKKKLEKDDMLLGLLPVLQARIERVLAQNSMTDIYTNYFEPPEFPDLAPEETPFVRTVNSYRDIWKIRRPVVAISWEPSDYSRIAVAHAKLDFQITDHSKNTYSYIWSLMDPSKPELVLDAGYQISTIAYNPREKRMLVAGMTNGQMCYWDTRKGSKPISFSGYYNSFRDVPSKVIWIASKTGNECMSASPDGQILWWDVRNWEFPFESMLMDLGKSESPSFAAAVGISSLEYQATIPNKFMAGTEKGTVISVNRKARTMNEKIGTIFNCHMTPVRSIERNPSLFKVFLTAGDRAWKIWSEDSKESWILSYGLGTCEISSAAWNPHRTSVFYVAKKDGSMDIWDLLLRSDQPVHSHLISKLPLSVIACHDDGLLTAVGDDEGTATIVETSHHYQRIGKMEKQLMLNRFERETHREKLIEAKLREIRLKARQESEFPASEARPGQDDSLIIKEFEENLKKFRLQREKRYVNMGYGKPVSSLSAGSAPTEVSSHESV
ncbi:Hypothetical protein NTJ_14189 [Nesidiocoris tenuis]|uniref:Dynein intermediate chain 3, ciliary n=1 Tax=Nesidiocoris tenuis TaxID=355587 RepID=A0ABN7BCH0_9HEMI|nr:Hypothetical protein NTJ_14189 [Nesidiocoris tenuis]